MVLTVLLLSAQLLMMAMPVTTHELEFRPMESEFPMIETSGMLVEGRVVSITCSAVTPAASPPPELNWNLQQDSQNQIEENGNRTFTTKIQENVTLLEKHNGFNITCLARYPLNGGCTVTAVGTLTLDVLYIMVDISPSDPVSVGSMVNLTCSCRGNPPLVHFGWIMITDGRPELISVNTAVYSFKVTNSDRGRLYFCGCGNSYVTKFSLGHQLMFEGDRQSEVVGAQVIVKILGIIMLVGALVIFVWWFRSRRSTKPVKFQQDAAEADYVNKVVEIQAS
ncbi:uncharacterized protein LOC126397931 [Epinephelus moara]|uniref:uncharacterized protein LOC126397931 n=1 Tax=Epinephelus moara TaxID=300413 RepID=UPI00214E4FBE|nr:uncharacterized protein LOC126397931 [Epinephelus moara]